MIEYMDSLVAFIDVMGFKELLGTDEASRAHLERYYAAAKRILNSKHDLYASSAPEDNFQHMFVSDAIFLSVKIRLSDASSFLTVGRFFNTIANIQSELAINERIWTRGAISIGPLHFKSEENILVGKSFVQAYNLEATADYPRLLIDPQIFKNFGLTSNGFMATLSRAFDGLKILSAHNEPLIGKIQFHTEEPFLDWFRVALIGQRDIAPFLLDLQSRMNGSMELHKKGNKLLSYIFYSTAILKNDIEEQRTSVRPDLNYLERKLIEIGQYL